jgi:hypothetical protein
VYNAEDAKITFTTRGKEYVVDYLLPGNHEFHGLTIDEAIVKVPESGFGMFYDMGYTEPRIANYGSTSNGFSRHYVYAREWVLCLAKQ